MERNLKVEEKQRNENFGKLKKTEKETLTWEKRGKIGKGREKREGKEH